jgi:hypothetical protein
MKKRNLYQSLTIMCGLFSLAFTFNSSQITWLWKGNEAVGIMLVAVALGFATQWFKQQRLLKKST